MEKQKYDQQSDKESQIGMGMELFLFNDDYNTFEYVIENLIEICNHEPEQAEQCALIAHFKGKCGIKIGSFEELQPINNLLNQRGLSTILI